MTKTKLLRTIIQLGIGIVILLWLFLMADLSKVFSEILEASSLNILLATLFFIIASTFVALALYIPLRRNNPATPVHKVIMASFAGQLLSDVTPMRSGYFLTPFILKGLADVPVERGIASVLATGGINSFVKVALCLLGVAYFVRFLTLDAIIVNALFVGSLLLLAGGVFLLLLIWERRLTKLVEKFERIPVLGSQIRKFMRIFDNVQEEGRKLKGSLVAIAILILFSVITNATALYFISQSLHTHNPPQLLDFFFIASLASALMYVPITVAGLGVQEAGYVFLLNSLFGIPIAEATAFAFIARLLFTGTDIIGVGPLLKIGWKREVFKENP